jgi:hypothetical protein
VAVTAIWIGVCVKARFDWRLLILIVGAFVGGASFLVYKWRDTVRDREVAAIGLDKQLTTYLAPPTSKTTGVTYRGQKLVLVNMDERNVDPLFFEMPARLKPAKADDVDTIVQLWWKQNQVGSYSNGAKAMQWTCQCAVIERKTNALVAERVFTGSEPPRSTKSRGSASGNKPEDAVMGFITGLAR